MRTLEAELALYDGSAAIAPRIRTLGSIAFSRRRDRSRPRIQARVVRSSQRFSYAPLSCTCSPAKSRSNRFKYLRSRSASLLDVRRALLA